MRSTKKHFEKSLKNILVVTTALFVALLFIGNAAATRIITDNTIAINTNQIKGEEIFPFPHETSRDPWDLYFSFDLEAATGSAQNAGAEFDGDYFYSTVWASNLIHQFDTSGILQKEFSIAGVSGLRDLAYNPNTGTFYGGAGGATIWEMDFESETLVSTITGDFQCRAIAYNHDDNVIYCSNWDDPVWVVDPATGTIIDWFRLHTLDSTYGFAYDNDGTNRYLYIFDQGESYGYPQYIYQWDLNAGAMTGFFYSVTSDFPMNDAIAGGLFVSDGLDPNNVVIGGCLQGSPDMMFAYELRPSGSGDTTPPVTTCTLEGDMEGGIYISDVTVTLTATDDDSGVNYTMYKLDDGAWTTYEDSFVVTEDGEHTVYFYSVDNAGNIEDEKSETFTIQHQAPSISITIKGGFGVSAEIKNTGETNLTDIDWTISLNGSLIFVGKTKSGTITSLAPGDTETVKTFVLGIGKTGIAVEAGDASATASGTVILFFVIGVS
ncbi:MAG: hypothetical protein BV458_10320 [Thermoplasmata archaeon M9B2D]|nr:MAG: hypothetical protein BV458_10320 [Thermoplasmata archaeon M9B2D]